MTDEDMIRAPWTKKQVKALNGYQRGYRTSFNHPFTCSNNHYEESRLLLATKDGWTCPSCEYTQDWAHKFMFDPASQQFDAEKYIAEHPDPTPEPTSLDKVKQRYVTAMNSMQSGVYAQDSLLQTETSPSHLRSGVNSAIIQTSVLADLLIAKGVITEEEWFEGIATRAEGEVKRYEQTIAKLTGN